MQRKLPVRQRLVQIGLQLGTVVDGDLHPGSKNTGRRRAAP